MIEQLFLELGFSENVSRIYLRLLETGPSSARVLAENLDIPRPTVYEQF
jgi:sugar-specific transcriptional regulator TrmB